MSSTLHRIPGRDSRINRLLDRVHDQLQDASIALEDGCRGEAAARLRRASALALAAADETLGGVERSTPPIPPIEAG
jgi:hypothetical protein